MKDGSISVKLAPNLEMSNLQTQVDDLGNSNDIISNDGFFPDISIADFRNKSRLDGTVTETRLKDALIESIAAVNDELAEFKINAKNTALSAIDAPKIDGESVLVYRYNRQAAKLTQAVQNLQAQQSQQTKELNNALQKNQNWSNQPVPDDVSRLFKQRHPH